MLITLLTIAVALGLFLVYVATRPARFTYSRSGLISADPEKIFPFISRLELGGSWSPYEKRDPAMKKTFSGSDGAPGAMMVFEGKPKVGVGQVEILKVVPNELVELRLIMTKPMTCDNLIRYSLTKEGPSTRFTWFMEGDNGFMGKLMTTLIDCEKLLGKDMSEGIENLKKVVE